MFTKRVVLVLVSLCCLFIALSPSPTLAQSASTGTVKGELKDSTGAAVPGASITLTDTATKDTRTTTSNESGAYFFANVVPGTYTVTIKKVGFRVAQFSNQVVTVGSALTLNTSLEVGSATQVIEVTTTGAELQTLNSTVGNSITASTLDKLPAIGRDTGSFLTLQPGVSPDGSVAGAVVDQSTFLLDGGQNTNDMDGSMNVYTPSFANDPTDGIVGGTATGVIPTPIDSVEEFKVGAVNQTADFNSSAGAQVQVVTRRGTNDWHGSAYEYYLNNAWDANGWNNNNGPKALTPYHYNRLGARIAGPIVPKKILGGKTYFFANYEGFWWPQATTFKQTVPSANMRAGILTFGGIQHNMATDTNCGPTGTTACDPRGIGINPLVKQLWTTYMPMGNIPGANPCTGITPTRCDGVNVVGFQSTLLLPQSSNFGVARLDHDFGDKWHFYVTYRDFKWIRATSNQTDIGGFFPGDKLGVASSTASRPSQPWYIVGGLTTNVSPNVTNDFHYSYLRNYWAWATKDGPPQLAGLGGALEIWGETQGTALIPFNVNTQSIRTRFWDGQDNSVRDDVTILHGKHLFTFGGAYSRNWDWHSRSDNGGGINFTPTYQLGENTTVGGGNVDFSSTRPFTCAALPCTSPVSSSTWARYSAGLLGIVTDSQVAYTRSGPTLTLNPPLTHAFDQSTIPYYNFYFSDSWHLKPTVTLTYGLGWTLEMPPTEANGKQIEFVDQAGQQIDTVAYLNARKAQALLGNVFNPEVGFALVGNTGGGQKYPYMPFYGSFSPRIAVAWSPNFDSGWMGKSLGSSKTVIRGGYSRIYGRLNGVDLVLVPLLGTGLIQPVQCLFALMNGTCGNAASGLSVANAFRIGTDGLVAPLPAASPTLPQPTFPGFNSVAAGAGSALDAHFRPNVIDSFDLTIQRQVSSKILIEVGYIGRIISHEFYNLNPDAVPYMMTLGGQQFASAYAAVETAMGCATSFSACGASGVPTVAPQPFFEAALAGTGYCNGFANCTTAVATKQFNNFANQAVWSLWSALDKGGIGGGPICNTVGGCTNANGTMVLQGQQTTSPGFIFARSMMNSPINSSPLGAGGQLTEGVALNGSYGHGNYNGGFVSVKVTNWHGVSAGANFTYSKALGSGGFVQASSSFTQNDAFNIDEQYGVQPFDRKFVFNSFLVYDLPFYKSQKGLIGHVLGGWSIAPVLVAGSGSPVGCGTNTGGQSYGSADANGYATSEQCHFTGNFIPNGEPALLQKTGPLPLSQFEIDCSPLCIYPTAAAQTAAVNLTRPGILGLDKKDSGVGPVYGHGYWNIDARLSRNFKVTERVSANFEVVFTNLFNHVVFQDPGFDPTNPTTFGSIGGQANLPRAMQLGGRILF